MAYAQTFTGNAGISCYASWSLQSTTARAPGLPAPERASHIEIQRVAEIMLTTQAITARFGRREEAEPIVVVTASIEADESIETDRDKTAVDASECPFVC